MDKLEKLKEMAQKSNIEIVDAHFSDNKKGACLHDLDDDSKAIILDDKHIETQAEETVLLAHELGHYETGSLYLLEATYNSPGYRNNVLWCEGRADQWSRNQLLPAEDIQNAIDRTGGGWEDMIEHLKLPAAYIQKTIEHYKNQGIIFDWPEIYG